jgi:hypothetical protein
MIERMIVISDRMLRDEKGGYVGREKASTGVAQP